MHYYDIPTKQRQYVRKSTYENMTDKKRVLYLKYVKKLLEKLSEDGDDSEDEVQEESLSSNGLTWRNKTKTARKLNTRNITFVGMRYRGDHVFSSDDEVRLEKEDNNPKDRNAVAVKVRKHKKWKHVAYTTRYDAVWLRSFEGFEELPLEWQKNSPTSCIYSIDLRPLENRGVVIQTKQNILGKNYRIRSMRARCEESDA